jgi:plastocyanin
MRRRHLLAPLALTPLLFAACGSDGGSSETPPANIDVTVVAPGGFKFDMDTYTAPATSGGFGMDFDNKDSQSHSVAFRDGNGDKVGPRVLLAPGKSKDFSVDLPAGTYELYCDVPGHEAGGMKATLTVS